MVRNKNPAGAGLWYVREDSQRLRINLISAIAHRPKPRNSTVLGSGICVRGVRRLAWAICTGQTPRTTAGSRKYLRRIAIVAGKISLTCLPCCNANPVPEDGKARESTAYMGCVTVLRDQV